MKMGTTTVEGNVTPAQVDAVLAEIQEDAQSVPQMN